MKGLPYFCWYPGDFDNDENVRLMDLEQVGLYAKCLNHAWMNGSLPKDREEIRRLMNLSKVQFARAWVRVEPCFMEDPERPTRLINPRQEIERCAATEKSLTNRRSAKQRWEKKRNANASANACETQYNPRYDSDSDSSEVVKTQEANFELSDYFEKLYAAHPKKTGRILAEQALVDVVSISTSPKAVMRRIAEAHQAQLPELSRDAGRWCPQLHKWLSDGKYMDDAPEPPQTLEERIASL